MISAILAAAALFAQAAPAAAPAPAGAPAPDPAKPAAAAANVVSPVTVNGGKPKPVEETQVICHKEPVLGSLFPKEVCATKRDFAERRQQDQEQVREWVALKPFKVN